MSREFVFSAVAALGSLVALSTAFESLSLLKGWRQKREEAKFLEEGKEKVDLVLDNRANYGGPPKQIRKLYRIKPVRPDYRTPITACILVIVVFALSVGVVWSLAKMGGPLGASVDTSVKKLGGSVVVAGTGAFGAFFGIALMALGAIYVFGFRK